MGGRNFFVFVIIVGVIFSAGEVFAHEIFWYDRNTNFDRFGKVVIFPLTNVWDAPDDYLLGGEGTRNFRLNSYIDDRLTKKLKRINFIRLANEIREKGDILNNLYGELLQPFEDEKARATAVEEATMADMYLVPRFLENRVQEDVSPRWEWDVELSSWLEIVNGPSGYEIRDRHSRNVHHVIPEAKIYLHILRVDFTGYDKDANKILTAVQQNRAYNTSELSQFHTLVDEFQKAFTDAYEAKNKIAASSIRVGFTPIEVAGEFGDEYMSRAMEFALETEALKRIKSARVEMDPNQPVNFYVRSNVTVCDLIPIWHNPSYSVTNNLVRTEKRTWRDREGKEHEATLNFYDQSIVDHYAYWSFNWAVAANFWLVTPDNAVIISETYHEADDKPVDAFRHFAEDFCKKVNSQLKR